ncbi:MAG: DUF4870 domain-containing protein [Pyrinomonadaceae bacterium]
MQNSPYGQQNYQQQPGNQYGGSTSGMQPNLAALLSYIFIPITSIIFLVIEKENRLVRFHAMQAIIFGVTIFVISIALTIVMTILTFILVAVSESLAILGWLVWLLGWLAFSLVILIGWIMCLVKAYQGVMFKLPIVGNFAEKFTNK